MEIYLQTELENVCELVVVGRALAGFGDDADMLGTPLASYAKNVVSEVIGVGRAGTLVDWEDQVEERAYAVGIGWG